MKRHTYNVVVLCLTAAPQHRSLLWPGSSGVALFLVLLPIAFVITVVVVNRPPPPPAPPLPELPRAPRNRARDHRRAVRRYARYLGRYLGRRYEVSPKRRSAETRRWWHPLIGRVQKVEERYNILSYSMLRRRSRRIVRRWLKSLDALPAGPDPPMTVCAAKLKS